MDSTSSVQFRCVRHLHPSFKTETKHHHSINEMSLFLPFPLPVLFVIYAYKTVLVFIMLKNLFLVPPSLDFRKSLIGLQLFSPLLGPWHACLWAEGRRPGHPGTGQMLGLRGGSGSSSGGGSRRRLRDGGGGGGDRGGADSGCGGGGGGPLRAAPGHSLHAGLQPVVRWRCVSAHGPHLRVDIVRRLLLDARGRHAFFLLASVAEPDPHDLLFQLQAVGQVGDLLRRGFRALEEVALQRAFDANLDGGPLLALAALRCDLVNAGGAAGARVGLLQPLVQQRLELAHVLETELQGLEAADGGLREHIAIQSAQSQPHVRLGEAQLDAPLLELLSELLQVVRRRRVLVRVRVVAVESWPRAAAAVMWGSLRVVRVRRVRVRVVVMVVMMLRQLGRVPAH